MKKTVFTDDEKIYVSVVRRRKLDYFSYHYAIKDTEFNASNLLVFKKKELEILEEKVIGYDFRIIDYDEGNKLFDLLVIELNNGLQTICYAHADESFTLLDKEFVFSKLTYASHRRTQKKLLEYRVDGKKIFFFIPYFIL